MPVSSLVVHVQPEPLRAGELLNELAARPEFELGPVNGRRAAVVLDTPSEDENKRAWHWLKRHPGTAHVDVLHIHFEDSLEDPAEADQ